MMKIFELNSLNPGFDFIDFQPKQDTFPLGSALGAVNAQ